MSSSTTERDIRASSHMTDTEALMWAAEGDPFLSSGMGSVFLTDEPLDFPRLLDQLDNASKGVLRLREHVVDGIGLAPPHWEIDPNFDVANHVRSHQLTGSKDLAEVLELAASHMETPFNRARPLWEFIAIDGLADGTGALILKVHHSVSDGIGALRLATMYLDLERNPEPKPVADTPEADDANLFSTAWADLEHVTKKQLVVARRAMAEVAMWGADSGRIKSSVRQFASIAKTVTNQMAGPDGGPNSGSDLWANRSAKRQLEVFDLNLGELKATAKALGGTINDIFVTGSVMAADRYHREYNSEVKSFNLSLVMSTRTDEAAGGNSFAPVPFNVKVSDEPLSAQEWFVEVRAAIAHKLETSVSDTADAMAVMAGFASLLPSAVIQKAGRARGARQDWATSNLRGSPIPLFVAGAQVTHMYPVGPLAGTALNLTAMSYGEAMHVGMFVDPIAIDSPADLRNYLVSAYEELNKAASK